MQPAYTPITWSLVLTTNHATNTQRRQVLEKDPFETLDRDGVGQLMRTAVAKGRGVAGKSVAFGICGEHGGDPQSVRGRMLLSCV